MGTSSESSAQVRVSGSSGHGQGHSSRKSVHHLPMLFSTALTAASVTAKAGAKWRAGNKTACLCILFVGGLRSTERHFCSTVSASTAAYT